MKSLALTGLAMAMSGFALTPALAQDDHHGARDTAPGQDRVCLITWATAADAATGSDATALSGRYLPRQAAEAQAARSGGKSRVFDYSGRTVTGNTGTFTITTNEEERAFCEGAEFNPSLRTG